MSIDETQSKPFQPPRDPSPEHAPPPKSHDIALDVLGNIAEHTAQCDTLHTDNITTPEKSPSSFYTVVRDSVSSIFHEIKTVSHQVKHAVIKKATSRVAALILPEPGTYKNEIETIRNELKTLTGNTVVAQTAQAIGKHSIQTSIWMLTHPEKLHPKDVDNPLLRDYFTCQEETVSVSVSGRSWLTLLQKHTALLEEVYELNILNMMKSALSRMKKIQEEKPFLLIELLQDTLHTLTQEIQGIDVKAIEAPSQTTSKTPRPRSQSDELFLESFSRKILKLLFPEGEKNIQTPAPFILKQENKLFEKIKKTIPFVASSAFDNLLSDEFKNTILAQMVTGLQTLFSETASNTSPLPTTQPTTSYPEANQNAFNQSIKKAVTAFIQYIDPSLPKWIVKKIALSIGNKGSLLTEKLLSLDINQMMNSSLQKMVSKLSPNGKWVEKEGRMEFDFVFEKPKTFLEKEKLKQDQDVLNKSIINSSSTTIAKNLDGLIHRIAGNKNVPEATPDPKRLSRIRTVLQKLLLSVKTTAIKFLFLVLRMRKRITKATDRTINLVRKLDFNTLLVPTKNVIVEL